MTTTLQIRIDSKLKNSLKRKFKEAGVDLSTGLRLWAEGVVKAKEPVVMRTVNGFTPEYEQMILRETREAELHGKRYSTSEELHKAIFGNNED